MANLYLLLMGLVVSAEPAIEADVVVRGATLVDGSGAAGVVGDVAVRGERIVAVGRFEVAGTPRVLDGKGLIVAPGFIDLHTHSDYPLLNAATRGNRNYLHQGVTTVVTGNCGSGPVDVAKHFQSLESGKVGSNAIHQVPHNDVRRRVLKNANRAPTVDELRQMEELVDRAMKDGAWGLSTGLIYNPGTYSKTDELIALAKVAARHGGHYASHIRDEGAGVLAAIDEALTIGREAGLPVHISHLKASGQRAWGLAADEVALIAKARKAGQTVTADQYPYIASSTSLSATLIPTSFREGERKDYLARLNDAEELARLRPLLERGLERRKGGASIRIARYPKKPAWNGKDLAAIAAAEKRPAVDLVLEIERNGGAQIVNFGMREEDVRLIMRQPFVATASDGGSMVPSANTVPHPRGYGCFPRKIGRYALEDKIITLEHAIRSCSGLPADILRLPERGYLKAGYYADMVVFDPKTFRDAATFDKPHQYAPGVRYLFVNGQLAIGDGKFTGALAGKVLRHKDGKPEEKKGVQKDKKRAKFTIGKETTYVTGPLDEDGYVDYPTALNERLRKGVTPENNANVLIWKALGPRPEGKTMTAEYYKWLGMDPPPEKGDYFIPQSRYAKEQLKIGPGAALDAFQSEEIDRAFARPWTAKQLPRVAGWLKANEKPLAVVAQAIARPEYFSPLVPTRTKEGSSGLISALLPAVQKCREVAQALTIRAMLAAGEGRFDDAWRDLMACHRLGRLVARGSTLIEGLVGIAIDTFASSADLALLERAGANAKVDVKTIQGWLRDLQRLPPMSSIADKVDLCERFGSLDTFMLVARGGLPVLEALGGSPLPKDANPLMKHALDGVNWDPALRLANHWFDRMTAAMRVKDRAARQKQLGRIDADLKKQRKELMEGSALLALLLTPQKQGEQIGKIMITLLMPAVQKVQQAYDRSEQTQRNLHLAFALACYRREHGRYPDTLDALAPAHLERVPQDVFTGEELIYRPMGKGYLLYSFGVNGLDDGGQGYGNGGGADDLSVRMPLPKLREKGKEDKPEGKKEDKKDQVKSKFTLGKETTYVTGPLDEDGYIDYATALNERLRKGVTPENNANVLIWKALGPRPEGKEIPAEFFKWLSIDEPPKKGAYFISQDRYAREQLKLEMGPPLEAFTGEIARAGQRPWAAKQYPKVAGWLRVNDKPLTLVAEAVQRPDYFLPWAPPRTNAKRSSLMNGLFGLQSFRSVAQAFRVRAMLAVAEKRFDDAWRDLLACHRLGRLVARGATLIEVLLGLAIDKVASESDLALLEIAAADATVDVPKLRGWTRDVQRLPPMSGVADKWDFGERLLALDLFMLTARDGASTLEANVMGKAKDHAIRLMKLAPDGIDWEPALRFTNHLHDRVAAAMRLKERSERDKQLKQIQKEINEQIEKSKQSGPPTPQKMGEQIGQTLHGDLMPLLLLMLQAHDCREQIQRNLHVAFALACYRREHGRYPDKLDTLAPAYLERVPQDMFSGAALIYRPAEKGYLLYSLGVNERDDEGRGREDEEGADDLSVRMPLPKLRRK